jgi:hypothetical protein
MKYMRNALDVGLVPKDDLAKLKAGEQLSFTTNYGKGYFSLASMALTEKYDLDMDKEIPVSEKSSHTSHTSISPYILDLQGVSIIEYPKSVKNTKLKAFSNEIAPKHSFI